MTLNFLEKISPLNGTNRGTLQSSKDNKKNKRKLFFPLWALVKNSNHYFIKRHYLIVLLMEKKKR